MTILQRPKTGGFANTSAKSADKAAEAFIEGAYDTDRKGLMRGKKLQISLALKPELIDEVDDQAAKMGVTRAAFISRAIYMALHPDGQ